MRHKIFLVLLFSGLCAVFSEIKAQQMVVKIDKPFVSKNLSGIIVNLYGEKIPSATVTRFSYNWKEELETVKTDENGKFAFKKLSTGIFYLRITALDFNALEIKVKITRNAKTKLRLTLEIAT